MQINDRACVLLQVAGLQAFQHMLLGRSDLHIWCSVVRPCSIDSQHVSKEQCLQTAIRSVKKAVAAVCRLLTDDVLTMR